MSSSLPFTLRQLEYARAVRRTRNFRKAAALCNVSQPSLSTQLMELEQQLGCALFERAKGGARETPSGTQLLDQLERVLVEAQDLRSLADGQRDPLSGQLTLGVIPTVAPYLLPELDPGLRRAFPNLELRWVEEKTEALVALCERGELDAAVLAVEAPLGDLKVLTLGWDPFVLAVAPSHALARGKRPVKPEQLSGQRVLLLDDGHCFREQALDFCNQVKSRELGFRATSLTTLVQMTAGGDAITLLPSLSVPLENRRGGLSLRRLATPEPGRTLGLAFRKTSPLAPALEQLGREMAKLYAKTIEIKAQTKPRMRPNS